MNHGQRYSGPFVQRTLGGADPNVVLSPGPFDIGTRLVDTSAVPTPLSYQVIRVAGVKSWSPIGGGGGGGGITLPLAGDFDFTAQANHAIFVDPSVTASTVGGSLTVRGGNGSGPTSNGGGLRLDAGTGAGAGVGGTVLVGDTNAESVSVGRVGKTTTIVGILAVAQAATFSGALIASAIGPSSAQQHALPAVASDTIALLAATQSLSNKTLASPKITVGSDAVGDIWYNSSGATGVVARLPATTNGFVLTLAAGVPSWAANAAVPTTRAILTTAPLRANNGASASLAADVTLTVLDAAAGVAGVVNTSAQVLGAGIKTFPDGIEIGAGKAVAGAGALTVSAASALLTMTGSAITATAATGDLSLTSSVGGVNISGQSGGAFLGVGFSGAPNIEGDANGRVTFYSGAAQAVFLQLRNTAIDGENTITMVASGAVVKLDGTTTGAATFIETSVGHAFAASSISGTVSLVGATTFFADTSGGAVTGNLPTSPADGTTVEIVDAGNNAGTNNITINRGGTNTITAGTLTAQTNTKITTNGGSRTLKFKSSTGVWYVTGIGL